jgi:hypothetical protein
VLKTLIPTPSIDEIKITISKPGLLNTNPKLVMVTLPIIKSEKLSDPLIFNRN